jgi:hypothetical protein
MGNNMTKEEWLKGLTYDARTQSLLDNKSNKIIDLRGWAKLQKEFDTLDKCNNFQEGIGQFIIDAINEKLEKEKQLKQIE